MTDRGTLWKRISSSALTLEAIKSLHVPSQRFRISPARYPAGASFSGESRAGRVYVLAGSCRYAFGVTEFELVVGAFADVPEGGYQFQTVGSHEVEIVRVFELPREFWSNEPA